MNRKGRTMMGMHTTVRNGGIWSGLALLIAVLLLLSGCGGGDRGAQATAEQFAAALGRGDPAAARAVFGSPWDVEGHIANETGRFGAAQSAAVESVTVNGTTATVRTVWELERATIRNVWMLEQQGDRWVVVSPSMNAADRQVTEK